jgi:replicative DNA helicase
VIHIAESINNIQNEILFVGAIYKNPELIIEYSQYVKSKYDFDDIVTKFYYDNAVIIYQNRTQTFNKATISTYMTEDKERLSTFNKYGGWKTLESWIKLAITDDTKNYFEVLKKYSLLREYSRNGFDVSKIQNHKRFESFSALDIYRLIRGKTDRIQTVIMTNSEAEILNTKVKDLIDECLDRPDMGLQTPYPSYNEMFRGLISGSTMATGMLSNAGKSRHMFRLIAFIALVLKEKVGVLLNEMSIKQMRYCLLTTVINNPEFQELHGFELNKKEREITLGLYRDSSNEYIYRELDNNSDFSENLEQFKQRLYDESEEYRNIKAIAEWIENETNGLIFVKDISSAYDDKTLEFELRKFKMVYGINYCFYDTCKSDVNAMGNWAELKATVTKLSEIAKPTNLNIFLYISIQLTDETNSIPPDALSSSNIANAKQLKHVVDTMVLFKEIEKREYKDFKYYKAFSDWGEPILHELRKDRRYYIGNTDKNRFGEKKKLLFEVDLDTNIWMELGEVVRQSIKHRE